MYRREWPRVSNCYLFESLGRSKYPPYLNYRLANLTQESSKRSLGSRRVTILILNHSPNQLELDPESAQLRRGKWEEAGEAVVPDAITPGGSLLLRCRSTGFARSVEGAVTCRLAGHAPHDSVRFTWKSRYVCPSAYAAQTSREGCTIDVDAGGGANAVVVFVFRKSYTDVHTYLYTWVTC
jgi:hypothetical protein